MILCLDVGNSQIYGGVFLGQELKLQFRRNSRTGASSDEYGLFLRAVLRENDIDPACIQQIAICTVVPETLHSIKNCCRKYFNINPFVLQAGVKTGLKINYMNPHEVGADRIANAIGAVERFPGENLIILDFGTATTFCAISKKREYLGGVIIAGLRISMESLETQTSKLPSVEIIQPERVLGRSTVEGIQAGLYYGTLGTVKEVIQQIRNEVFPEGPLRVIGTGGFASLFAKAQIFDIEIPDLVLEGLLRALLLSAQNEKTRRSHAAQHAEI